MDGLLVFFQLQRKGKFARILCRLSREGSHIVPVLDRILRGGVNSSCTVPLLKDDPFNLIPKSLCTVPLRT
jgi:hypothetical protein